MKLSQLKHIIKESVNNLIKEQSNIHATITCPPGFTARQTNAPGPAAQISGVSTATYTTQPGNEICFTCEPVEGSTPPRIPQARTGPLTHPLADTAGRVANPNPIRKNIRENKGCGCKK